uniref:Uncharacterized protein n=1 Tax=Panagrellus redivivus TaxID=6233 RepID=A0A7E4VXV3_PANRE
MVVDNSHFGEADCLDDGVQMGFGLRKASSTAGVKAFLPYEKATKTTSARTPVSMGYEGGASGIEWQLWERNPSGLLFEGDLMTETVTDILHLLFGRIIMSIRVTYEVTAVTCLRIEWQQQTENEPQRQRQRGETSRSN